MAYPYLLQFKPTVSLMDDANGTRVQGPQGRSSRLVSPHPALRWMLGQLVTGGMSAGALCESALRQGERMEPARLMYFLARLEKQRFLSYTLVGTDAMPLATLEPYVPGFALAEIDIAAGARYRLSRFAAISRIGGEMVMASPLGHARLVLQGPALAFAGSLALPQTLGELAARPTMPPADVCAALLGLLVSAGMAFPCDAQGLIPEDAHASLQQWEPHDLHLHYRSRFGSTDSPVGGTYRFFGEKPPLPACKKPMTEALIELKRPDMDALVQTDPPFSQVSESRRSIRQVGANPITLAALGEFLYRSVGIRELNPITDETGYETSGRPVASGGAMHDLEIYLFVNRCDNCETGLYHYDAAHHRLEHLQVTQAHHQHMLAHAMRVSLMAEPPDVLLVMAARFQRFNWKYEGIAHAERLKSVGALYQQMYLVATAMNLAPCALGLGDSGLFAAATGLDIHTEGSVGEFMLSAR
ncbi:MAG: SagB family peptide dehydrogenase [Burkholderiaceae bacterium]|nr:SagB family peptide dehydrogenase [Burkholderiaceae bacterium]